MAKTKIKKISYSRRKTGHKQTKIFKLNIICCVLFLALLAGYLVLLNSTTVDGYKLKKIENQVTDLKEKNNNLTLELSEKQSMENIMGRVADMNMVQTGKFDYVSMQPSEVAKR